MNPQLQVVFSLEDKKRDPEGENRLLSRVSAASAKLYPNEKGVTFNTVQLADGTRIAWFEVPGDLGNYSAIDDLCRPFRWNEPPVTPPRKGWRAIETWVL